MPIESGTLAAHRLGSALYGENASTSGDECIALGVTLLECDFRWTSDGVEVVQHDATLDYATTGTGTIAAMTWEQVSSAASDPNTYMRGTGYSESPVLTMDALLARYPSAVVLAEHKDVTSTWRVASVAQRWRDSGYADRVIIQAQSSTVCEEWIRWGFRTMVVTGSDLVNPAAYVAAGHTWVGYAFTGTGTAGEIARIAAAKAAGLRVAVWTLNRRHHIAAAWDAGADVVMTDHPTYATKSAVTASTSVTFSSGRYPVGTMAASGLYTEIVSGRLRTSGGASWSAGLIGACGPIEASTFSVTATLRHEGTPNQWAGIAVQGADDADYHGATGYRAGLAEDGTLTLYSYTSDGTETLIGSAASTAPSGGVDCEVTISVTPAGVSASTGGVTVSSSDTTHRPDRWWPHVCRGVGATPVGFSSVEVAI